MRALAFLLSFCLPLSAAFYFHAGEREEKCIIEDIPSDTLITALWPVVPTEMHQQECQRALGARHPRLSRFGVFSHHFFQFALLCFEMLHFLQTKGSFKLQQWDVVGQDFLESAPGLGLFVTVTTYSEEVLLSKLYGPQGTFHFTSHSPGEHIICLESNSTRLVSFGGSKLRIHLDIRVGEHDLEAAIAQAKDKVNEVSFKLEHLIEQIEQIVKEQNYQRDREENFRVTSEDTNSNVLWWAFAQTLILISVGIFQMKYLKDFFIAKKLV